MSTGTGSNTAGKYDGALSDLNDFIIQSIGELEQVPQVKANIVHNAAPMTLYMTKESSGKAGAFYDIHIIDISLGKPNVYDAILFMPQDMHKETDISKYIAAENEFSLCVPQGTSTDDLNSIYSSSQNHKNIIAAAIEEMNWSKKPLILI